MATIIASEVLGSKAPFEDIGITDDMFVPVDAIVDNKLTFVDVKNFENDKGPGVFIAFQYNEGYAYTATHSVGLVRAFGEGPIADALKGEDIVVGTIRKKKSKKTGNCFYVLE